MSHNPLLATATRPRQEAARIDVVASGSDPAATTEAAVANGLPIAELPFQARLAARLEAERPRWFLWLPVCLGIGIGCYFSAATEPTWSAVLAVGLVALVVRFFVRGGLVGDLVVPALMLVVAGFTLAKARVSYTTSPVLERTLYRADVSGVVTLIEPRAKRGERLTIKVIAIDQIKAERLPRLVRIRTLQSTPGLKPGDHIKLRAKLGPPSQPSFPGDYDFARAAWFQRLGGTGFSIKPADIVKRAAESDTASGFSRAIVQLRQAIGQRITAALPGESGAIATALITGERGGISEKSVTAFRDSGLLHILSISGLHMVIMAGAAFTGVRLLLSASPRLALYYPVKKWAAAIALLAGLGYLLISGSSVATLRSAIMVAIMFFAILIDRPAIAMRNVALAALILLVSMPETLLDAGFQMSFAAVICLVATYEVIRDRLGLEPDVEVAQSAVRRVGGFFGGIVLSTLIASIAVSPFAIYHFHQTQQYAIAANLLAIPVCNVIVMPAGLLTLIAMPLGLEAWPLWVMGRGIDMMMWAAEWVATIPGAVGRIAAVPQASLVFFATGCLWLTLWRTRWRYLGLLGVAAALIVAPLHEQARLIVGREGSLVALRGMDGLLYTTPGNRGGFELARWLAQDGDGRDVKLLSRTQSDAARTRVAGNPWRCDQSGCLATIDGLRIAALRHPAALSEECGAVDVLILTFKKPAIGCDQARLIFDRSDLIKGGTHALYFTSIETLRFDTVAASRGQRPWSVVAPSSPQPSDRNGEEAEPAKPQTSAPFDDLDANESDDSN
jgi:competence protein ComEC